MSFCKLQFPFHFRYSFFFHVMAPGFNKFYGGSLCHLRMLQSMCLHTPQWLSTKELSRIDKVKAPFFILSKIFHLYVLYWLSINIYICTKCSCIEIHTRTKSVRRNKKIRLFLSLWYLISTHFQIQCHRQVLQVLHVKIYMKKENNHDWDTKQKTQTNKQKQRFDIDWNF